MAGEQRDVVARVQVREQSAVLDHIAGAMAQRTDGVPAKSYPINLDRARIGLQQSDQQAQQCRLAAAAGPEEDGHALALEGDGQWCQAEARAEGAAQIVGLDHPSGPGSGGDAVTGRDISNGTKMLISAAPDRGSSTWDDPQALGSVTKAC